MEQSVDRMRVTLREHSDFITEMLKKIERRLGDEDVPPAQ
tara:strand:+ start:243 stop:362 length:120 start_codon:yes stop_codon:yes gene_type:complete